MAITDKINIITSHGAISKNRTIEIIVIAASTINGNVSNTLSATTVAKVSFNL